MSTKANPGAFDCYATAKEDEPMFVLLGRDPAAAMTILFWAELRRCLGQESTDAQVIEAKRCALHMEEWARDAGKAAAVRNAMNIYQSLLGGRA